MEEKELNDPCLDMELTEEDLMNLFIPEIPKIKIPSIPFPSIPSIPSIPSFPSLFSPKAERIPKYLPFLYELDFPSIDVS